MSQKIVKAGFGKPKPLPGQVGYGEKQSEKLQTDASQMEEKLRMLRDQMAQEQLARDSTNKVGGSRWRSARTDRGSIRNYAKDVKDGRVKPTKKKKEPTAGSSGVQDYLPSDFTMKEVNVWEVADTLEWLESLSLGIYKPNFEKNEISGPILVEVGLEDLDFMEIKMPAHRKLLLKGIESLKKNGRFVPLTQKPATPPVSMDSNVVGGDSRSAKVEINTQSRVHWSEVKPVSDNKIKGDGSLPVNLADGMYDEKAARDSFLEAVNEWRTGGGKVKIVNEADIYFGTGSGSTQTEPKGLFGISGDEAGMWVNPWADQFQDEVKTETETLPPKDPSGGKLLQGSLDEEAEHKAFANAVERWRKGDVGNTKDLAEKLSAQMDMEHRRNSANLAATKKQIQDLQNVQDKNKRVEFRDVEQVEEPPTPDQPHPMDFSNIEPDSYDSNSPPLSQASSEQNSPRDHDEAGISISLVDSTMGFDPKRSAKVDQDYIVVEEEENEV